MRQDRRSSRGKYVFFQALPYWLSHPPLSLQGQVGPFFSRCKNNVLFQITELCDDDDGNDNCDYNKAIFDLLAKKHVCK